MRIVLTKDHTPAELLALVVPVLQQGGLIIFPTETTYGAGVDATNPDAVNKLLAYKARREGKPLSIAVTNQAMAEQYVEVNEQARRLYQRFLPGPVTVVSKSLGRVAPGVESEFGTLGVRIPDYPLVLDIVSTLGKPVTATSANMSDGKRPYRIDELLASLPSKQQSLIDVVIDAGELPPNPPSTVIDTTLSTPVVFRQGDVQLESTQPTTTLISHDEAETQAIAGKLVLKHWNDVRNRGLVIGLNGSLGVGKTIFAKGVATFLNIDDTLASPTYTYIEEYDFTRHQTQGKLFHLDLWKIGSAEELALLKVPELVQPNHIVLIEWYSQVKPWVAELLKEAEVVEVTITETSPDHAHIRQLEIYEYKN